MKSSADSRSLCAITLKLRASSAALCGPISGRRSIVSSRADAEPVRLPGCSANRCCRLRFYLEMPSDHFLHYSQPTAISPRQLAASLNGRGIRTASDGAWYHSTVRNLLQRGVSA